MKKTPVIIIFMIISAVIIAGCTKVEKREVNVQMMSIPADVDLSFLPLGNIQARGWLLNQLKMQRDNITGQFEDLSPDVLTKGDNRSGWLGGSGESWERGPYYVRGLVLLAYTLNDSDLKQKAKLWIDCFINSQTASGAAGPYADKPEFDWWAVMPMLIALEEYHDATEDDRVLAFLDEYFRYQYANIDKNPLRDWGKARAGDNILSAKWLYDKTGEQYLLDLCNKLYKQADDWKTIYEKGSWGHIVNTHQSFKLFPLMYGITGDDLYRKTYYTGAENLFMTSGRIDGMSNGDELSGNIGATHGTETCAVAEQMFSDAIALKYFKDPLIADHLERITFNAWPSQLTPEITGQVYFTMQNQIEATLGYHRFTSDGGDRSVYGTPGGYPCCIHNFHMGWPEFVSNLWLKTSDNGLLVSAYSPSTVKTVVGDNTNITLTETTNYPFEDKVNIKIEADKTDSYPIYIRIPSWCKNAKIYVNNHLVAQGEPGTYVKLEAEWESGDNIKLQFPMELNTTLMENNSIGLTYGPLVYAVSINENWSKIDYVSGNWNVPENFASYDITPEGKWNYALEVDFENLSKSFAVERVKNYDYDKLVFRYDKSPIEIKAMGAEASDWVYDDSIKGAGPLPISPVKNYENKTSITLIPYSFARLRVALIPWYTKEGTGRSYKPGSVRKDQVVFNTVTAPLNPEDPNVKKGAVPVREYTGIFKYDLQNETVISVFVNNKLVEEITLSPDENTFTSLLPLKHGWYNKIEIKGTNIGESIHSLSIKDEGEIREYRWEAENVRILGQAQNRGNHVGGIDAVGDGISFDINADKAGEYTFRIYYCAALGNAKHDLQIDNKVSGTVMYTKTSSGWASFSNDIFREITVYLEEGSHTIKLIKPNTSAGFTEIDAVSLILN